MCDQPERLDNGRWTVPGSPVESFTVASEQDAKTLSAAFKLMEEVHSGEATGKDVAARFDAAQQTIARIGMKKRSSALRDFTKAAEQAKGDV